MAVNDLNDLFESVDGLTEDLMEYGIMAGAAVGSHIAFNAAVSFVTNTNWQAYSGESTMGHLAQMAGLTGNYDADPVATWQQTGGNNGYVRRESCKFCLRFLIFFQAYRGINGNIMLFCYLMDG